MAELVVGMVLGGAVLVALVASSRGGAAGRDLLERRRLRRALEMKVGELMSRPVFVVREETSIEAAAQIMLSRGIGGLPVVGSDGRIVGIVTDSDLTGVRTPLRFAFAQASPVGDRLRMAGAEETYPHAQHLRVREVMRRDVVTASPVDDVTTAVIRMMEGGLHRVPVVEEGVPVGMLSRRDLLPLLAGRAR